MVHMPSLRLIARLNLLWLVVVITCDQPAGAEPFKAFLQGLVDRQYFDMAIEYLDRAENASTVSPDQKKDVPLEKGIVLLHSAQRERDMTQRRKILAQAVDSLNHFIAQSPKHARIFEARNQLGNALVEQGRLTIANAQKSADAERPSVLSNAVKQFDEADKVFQSQIDELKSRLQKLAKVTIDKETNPEEYTLRNKLRTDYLHSRMLGAQVLYEKSAAVKHNKEEFQKVLKEAAERFRDISDSYRQKLVGLLALLYEGRSFQDLEDWNQALASFDQLTSLEDGPAQVRALKTKAMTRSIQCWIQTGATSDGLAKAEKWLKDARPNEMKTREWLQMRMAMAQAYQAEADSLVNEKKAGHADRLKSARVHALYITRIPGDLQQSARKLLAVVGGETDTDKKSEPATFVEALDRGKEAYTAMQSAAMREGILADRIEKADKPERREELKKDRERANLDVSNLRLDAISYFRMALKMADKSILVADVNRVRSYLGLLYYFDGDYFEAAALSEFVARQFPQNSGARQSAKIAMASYLQLYELINQEEESDASFELARAELMATYLVDTWPGHAESDDALATLINLAIRSGKLDKARQLLERISIESAKRGEAELRTGQAMWSHYLKLSRSLRQRENELNQKLSQGETVDAAEQDQNASDRAELENLKQAAAKTLEEGVQRMKVSGMSQTLATAVLSLVQIYVDTQQAQKAIDLLEDSQIGALTLVRNNHPTAQSSGYTEESYKAALRAYISSLPESQSVEDTDARMEKAEQIMQQMESSLGNSPAGQKRLITIYVSLARDLEEQIELAPPDVRSSLSKGFERFLERVGKDTSDFTIQNWVAESFHSLGQSNDDGTDPLPDIARKLYERAISVNKEILSRAQELGLESKTIARIRFRTASSCRRLQLFKNAITLYEEILQENNRLLNVQIEATKTYQQWGDSGEKNYYLGAMVGGRKHPQLQKNTIWGWIVLAKKADSAKQRQTTDEGRQKYDQLFHQARYNLAYCRYKYGMHFDGTKKTSKLQRASQDIVRIAKLYPQLGGDIWKKKYDQLLRQIQQSLGERPTGLAVRTPPYTK